MHKLIYAFLLLICLNSFAFAGVKMNSLGDYFHYLVPDVETDIEVFPTHLNFLEQRNIMLTAGDKYPSKKIGLNVYPLLGKISYGMKASFASGEYLYRKEYFPVIYLGDIDYINPVYPDIIITEPKGYKGYLSDSYENSNRSGFYIKNFLSLKIINDCHIGIKFNWIKNWITKDEYEIKNLLPYGYDYYNREDSEYRDLDDDSYSTGFNFCFGTILRKDISMEYRKREYNDFEIDKRIFKRGYLDDNNKNYFDSNLSQNSYDLDCEEYRINILLEKKNNKRFWRLYLSSLFSIEDAVSKYHNEDIDESYMNVDTLRSANWSYYDEGTTTKSKYYQTVIGWGQNWISKKVQLFYGIKLQGSYEKITTDKYNQSKNIYYRYDSYNDSTTIDTTTYEDALSDIVEKDWQATINLPLGMEYKLKDNLTLYCGLGYRITRRLVEYSGRDFYYWITDEYQSVGVEFKPVKNLELGLNLNGDLASFSNWQVEVRYLF